MRKLLLTGLILCLMVMPAFADANRSKVVESAHMTGDTASLSVPTSHTIYTYSFPIKSANSEMDIGVTYYQTPATGDTKITFEQSYRQPTTEGSADVTYVESHIIDASATGSQWELATIDTVDLMYGRFKIVGQGTNPANTVLSIKFVK